MSDQYDEPPIQSNVVDLEMARATAALRKAPKKALEQALAKQFADRYCDELIYIPTLKRWFYWTGSRWEYDQTLRAGRALSEMLMKEADKLEKHIRDKRNSEMPMSVASTDWRRVAYESETDDEVARKVNRLGSAQTHRNVMELARMNDKLAMKPDIWDGEASVMLLNTPEGTVDLRDTRPSLRPHRPRDYITKMTAISPRKMPTPNWDKFMEDLSGGDRELAGFLQRMSGYFLTGDTGEQKIFFGHGPAQTGKSTFVKVLEDILFSYSRTTDVETFIESAHTKHSVEVADLWGARLVTASETREGRKWNVPRVKQMTGGDTLSARFMHSNPFTFTPQFKIFIVGNNQPEFSSMDEAIRRRFYLVPFMNRIPMEKRDNRLLEKLKAEFPGILQWMIDGYSEYMQKGLMPPAAITNATQEYLAEEDEIERWFQDCVEHDSANKVAGFDLYDSYKTWCKTYGECVARPRNTFYKILHQNAGYYKVRKGKGAEGVYFTGIRMKPQGEPD